MKHVMAALIASGAVLAGGAAKAAEVLEYTTISVSGADATQMGRLTRARPPSSWAEATPFPGFINTSTAYQYRTVQAAFAPNALQDVYYEITVDDPDAIVFASAYDGAYDPASPANNYLGDEGASGNYFPGDPSFFDIVVPMGGTLTLVFNDVGLGDGPFSYQVSAFSSTEYDENFQSAPADVPEPATWAMFIGGFGLVGAAMRRRRTVRVRFA